MGSLGPFEIIAILVLVLLLFGAKRIPEIARGLGRGIREFRDATTDIKRELDIDAPPPQRRVEPPRHEPMPRADSPAQSQTEPATPAKPAASETTRQGSEG